MGQQGNMMSLLFPLAMFVAIFYFMIVRPQKKRQKAQEDMLASISTGDEIITAGGFFGVVDKILDDSYIVVMDKNLGTKARVLKTSVSMKKPAEVKAASVEEKPKKKKKIVKKEVEVKEEEKTEAVKKAVEKATAPAKKKKETATKAADKAKE